MALRSPCRHRLQGRSSLAPTPSDCGHVHLFLGLKCHLTPQDKKNGQVQARCFHFPNPPTTNSRTKVNRNINQCLVPALSLRLATLISWITMETTVKGLRYTPSTSTTRALIMSQSNLPPDTTRNAPLETGLALAAQANSNYRRIQKAPGIGSASDATQAIRKTTWFSEAMP